MTLRELLVFLSKNEAFYLNKVPIPMYLVVNPLMEKDTFFVYDKNFKKIWLGVLSNFLWHKNMLIASYMISKSKLDSSIDIDLIESSQWEVIKKEISFEATFVEKDNYVDSFNFNNFNDEAKDQITEKYKILKNKYQKLSIDFEAILKSIGHPKEPEKMIIEKIRLSSACYDNIFLELEHIFQYYAKHVQFNLSDKTYSYR
ncbi:hypothetical protein CDJ58_03845 [Campylobacter lari]|nr:hypothetical protein [Campylobacter lari]EAI7269853.1 hypothetical protein [Campylobacter lari]EAK5748532.1 hypothetical protein [Campylobacter lari]EAK5787030.1 hypothetical protein [Campylobacter lari]EAK9878194.1 hypothetical protein [Campylobacter lari]